MAPGGEGVLNVSGACDSNGALSSALRWEERWERKRQGD